MKSIIIACLLLLTTTAWGQIPSDCTIPQVLREAYDTDVKGMAIKRMQAQNSPDGELIEIPQTVQDSILEGMAAIFNLSSTLPEADSVFNKYCVHDNFGSPAVFGFIIGVDTASPMADAWSQGNLLTGNTILDDLLTNYNFTLQNYFSFGAGVFYTDRILNLFALADSITASVPGVEYGEPDFFIGNAGRINYSTDQQGNRLYEFRYEWNDCFDGCDNYYSWFFTVSPNCDVTFTGTDEGGFFGIEDLPEPTNCQLTTGIDAPIAYPDFNLFPNPTSDQLNWQNAPEDGSWRMYNAQGQLVQQGQWAVDKIDVSNWVNGIYWLQAISQDGKTLFQRSWLKQ